MKPKYIYIYIQSHIICMYRCILCVLLIQVKLAITFTCILSAIFVYAIVLN